MQSEFYVVWVNKTSLDILIFKAQKYIFEFSCYQNLMWYELTKPVLTYSFLKLRKTFLSFHAIRILCGMV